MADISVKSPKSKSVGAATSGREFVLGSLPSPMQYFQSPFTDFRAEVEQAIEFLDVLSHLIFC